MNLPCIGRHKWDGCTCSHCGKARDEQHAWEGCVCRRCGLKRDQDHDWEVVQCLRKCRRCGHAGGELHDFLGCVCRDCGSTQHVWTGARCQRCGMVCKHPETTTMIVGVDSEDTCQGRVMRVCRECGEQLAQIWKK